MNIEVHLAGCTSTLNKFTLKGKIERASNDALLFSGKFYLDML
jgi:hypothetical protein